jgi:alkyldihydroxyacetonephosphate synthase
VLATILFEGNRQEVSQEIKIVRKIANANKGVNAGPSNGERGYFLTFAIAYLRDFAMDYELIGESFETSISWNNVTGFC